MFSSRVFLFCILPLGSILSAQDAQPAAKTAAEPSAPAKPKADGGVSGVAPTSQSATAEDRPGPPPGGPGGFRRRFGGGGEGGLGGPPGMGTAASIDPSALAQTIRMEGDRIVLQFPNNPVMDMLAIYEFLTGITLIKDTAILEGAPVSLATPKPVEKSEAIKLIEATLLTNGYAIVMEPDGKSARILPARSQSANAVQFSHGVKFYTSPMDLPQGESIVTYFMKLDNLDPEQAATMLSGHVGLNVYGRITPVLTPPGLLITESSTIVRQLISIREAIDLPANAASLLTKFIPLEHADAATVAQIIQATLTAQAQEKESKGVNTIRGNAASDGKERREGDNNSNNRPEPPRVNPIFVNGQWVIPNSPSEPATTAQVVADTRLNQILVVASQADYTYIASMIAEFDKPLKVEAPYERKLRYAAAVDVLSAVVDLLTEPTGGTTSLPGGGSLQGQRQQALASSSSQLLGGRSTTGTRGGQVLSTAGSGTAEDTATSTGTAGRADLIQGPTEDNAPVSVLVGKTRVVADPMSNTILVVGRSSEIEKVGGLLDRLDRKPAQVYLATVIGQLTLGDGFDFGVDYLGDVGNGTDKPNFTAGQNITGLLGSGNNVRVQDIRNNLMRSVPAGSGLNLYGAVGSGLEVFVSALQTTNRFQVLSRPSVFALNNKKAVITSGRLIPVPAQTVQNLNNNNLGTFTTTIDYRDVVLKLEVVPLINDEGEVNLTIAQVNDTVVDNAVIAQNTVPIIATEQLVTSVNVRDGNTIVLGGLISESDKKNTSGTPILSRIPGVGNLFKRNQNSSERKELLIFIQPRVVSSDGELTLTSTKEDQRTRIGADAAARFPEEVNVEPVGNSNQQTNPTQSTQKKQGNFFQRMFRRDSGVDR
jgi:general secretion pathway protein D